MSIKKKINKLTNKIKDLSNKNYEEISYLKNKTNNQPELNAKINKEEQELIEKDKEIESFKIIMKQRDKENTIFEQNIQQLNESVNNIENDLKQKDEILKDNSNNICLLDEKIKNAEINLNRNFQEIHDFKKFEFNLALLVDFTIEIKADFYIENRQVYLCPHKFYDYDRYDDSRIKIFAHRDQEDGCLWKFK